jgi:hypothetical protein
MLVKQNGDGTSGFYEYYVLCLIIGFIGGDGDL